jgi:hypothetical protein
LYSICVFGLWLFHLFNYVYILFDSYLLILWFIHFFFVVGICRHTAGPYITSETFVLTPFCFVQFLVLSPHGKTRSENDSEGNGSKAPAQWTLTLKAYTHNGRFHFFFVVSFWSCYQFRSVPSHSFLSPLPFFPPFFGFWLCYLIFPLFGLSHRPILVGKNTSKTLRQFDG